MQVVDLPRGVRVVGGGDGITGRPDVRRQPGVLLVPFGDDEDERMRCAHHVSSSGARVTPTRCGARAPLALSARDLKSVLFVFIIGGAHGGSL